MRILALVPGGMDDQILFFPTLDDLKQHYPEAQIDVVIEPRAKAAYRVSKTVSDTILFDFEGSNSLADWGNLLGVIRDREYAIALSPSQRWGMGFLLWLAGIDTRIGYAGNAASEALLTRTVPLKQEQYAADMYHDLLKGLDIKTPTPELAVSVPTKDLEWADAERQRLGIQGGGYVLIYGGVSQTSQMKGADKTYPAENWKKIVQDFQQRQPDLSIVVVKESEDEEFIAELMNVCPGLKLTAPHNVGQLVAMIAGASLLLCTESAPMHLGIAAQTFTLALFGATDPDRLLPKSERVSSIKSLTGAIADIAPTMVLDRVWGG
ncbi:glycosyltransferase family 9 protein [Myxacorys almedinensis]|uniref:Lipopolysaccharide heptosyltransferase family protein n=1 Tax=Myxacorys almedinensis A TaxID=2690445 RepID=A0A8J7Z5J2_9CYAN|nr:glycosyltransferase family 9 protein [Myxacorys almedinensis]NDJ19780.1 lipopolysaccharide heptosyltransferase family protein [Myxacorys almedinensis A]